ncbi:MAG TPA: aldo/keto reductase [Acidimicrobiales bacterium]|nr:aldo/keto reductase [Acidimicrobiales bacterium]
METRKLGSLEVSLVGVGCNNFGGRIDEAATKAVVDAAIGAGITLFDTADVYGGGGTSEEVLGRALGARRDQVIVATKFGMPMGDGKAGAAPDYVRAACDASLARLGTDRIDLYQLHAPDANVPIAETLGALDELVRAGKVREIGCSNFTPEQIDEAAHVSAGAGIARFVSVQNELSLLRGDLAIVDAATRHDMGILPYFPLASGMLTGKYRRGEAPPAGTRLASLPDERRERALSDKAFDKVERLAAYAAGQGHTLLELAMSWLASLPAMASIIAGATKPEQVVANAAAVAWRLTGDERDAVTALSR